MQQQAGVVPRFIAVVGLALLLSACGGGSDDSTPTTEPVEAAVVEPTPTVEPATATATTEPRTPTPSPEPEPSATPTRSGPAPTVAMPIQRPPTEIPAAPTPIPADPTPIPQDPTLEPEPAQEVPAEEASGPVIGELLMESDLSDWGEVDYEFGSGYLAGGTYHLGVTEPNGAFISLYSNEAAFGDILVTFDVRLVTDSVNVLGCIMARANYDLQDHYALCITDRGETLGYYRYFDADGLAVDETLLELALREGVNAASEWNSLSIISYGEEIGFIVNDTFLGSTTHVGPLTGSVGFYVENYDPNGVEFEFSYLQVWAVK